MKCSDVEIKGPDYEFEIKEHPDNKVKRVELFEKYEKKSGVWACWGIDKKSKEWVCLNVGSGKTIGKEMRIDKMYSEDIFRHKKGEFKNYLNEVVFTFYRPNDKPITTRERVWSDIGHNYTNLMFFIVLESSNEEEMLKIEMEYAQDKKARYWNRSPKQKKN